MQDSNMQGTGVVSTEAHRVCAALSQPVMLELLNALHQSPASVTSLAEQLEYDISAISRKLSVLLGLGLVRYKRVGRSHVYELTTAVQMNFDGDCARLEITSNDRTSVEIRERRPSQVHESKPTQPTPMWH